MNDQIIQLISPKPLIDYGPDILLGFWATIRLTVVSGVLALVLGTVLAAMRVSPTPVLRSAGTLYVNIFRNTPLTLVLLFCSLALSDTLKIKISDEPTIQGFWLAIIGLTVYHAAFVCESLRAGVNTVDRGQAEAARSIGLTFGQTLRLVVLPQAFRAVIAPLGSLLIALTKNTTVVIVAGYWEAASQMKQMFDEVAATPAIFAGFALGFMILTLPTGFFFGRLAKRMAVIR